LYYLDNLSLSLQDASDSKTFQVKREQKRAGGVVQVVEHLLSKPEALPQIQVIVLWVMRETKIIETLTFRSNLIRLTLLQRNCMFQNQKFGLLNPVQCDCHDEELVLDPRKKIPLYLSPLFNHGWTQTFESLY
jgi:hypothetical protein